MAKAAKQSETKRKTETKRGSKRNAQKKTEKSSFLKRFLRKFFIFCLVAGLLGVAAVALAFYYYSRSLPGIFSYDDYRPRQMTLITDRNGLPILELYDERRTVVSFADIPQHMKDAMISAEDADFYKHKGLDYVGIARAVLLAIKNRGARQGASTITQQVVKNLILTPEKSMARKFQEAMLARQIERALTKDEILAIYLNHVYFGHRNYGVEQAALYYFGAHAKDLTLNQAATLAGLVQSPERLSPVKHMKEAVARRNYVLRQMYEKGHIAEDVYRAEIAKDIVLNAEKRATIGRAPYYAEHVRQMLIDEYGKEYVYNSGMVVTTALDLGVQDYAEAAFQKGLIDFDERHYINRPLKNPSKKPPKKYEKDKNFEAAIVKIEGDTVYFDVEGQALPYKPTMRQRKEKPLEETFKAGQTWFVRPMRLDDRMKPAQIAIPDGPDGALVAIDPATSEVVALVGGYSYKTSVFNRATQAMRQTGSSFKTFVYGAALEARVITPSTIIDDAPKVFHIPGQKTPWSAKNSDNKYKGPMTARAALALSRNTVAVDVLERVGIEKAIRFVRKFGISTPLAENYTLALGSSEMTALAMTNAYAAIAAGGMYKSPKFILKIARNGEDVAIAPQERHRAADPDVAYVLTSMLQSVATQGTARRHLGKFKGGIAGKTGTTNSAKDAWFVGFSPQLAAGVYVGYDDPKPLGRGEGGSTTALPIFADFMKNFDGGGDKSHFVIPDNVIQIDVDAQSGLLPAAGRETRAEVFLQGTQPTRQAAMPDEESAQNWMIRQIQTPIEAETDAQDVGGEDEF